MSENNFLDLSRYDDGRWIRLFDFINFFIEIDYVYTRDKRDEKTFIKIYRNRGNMWYDGLSKKRVCKEYSECSFIDYATTELPIFYKLKIEKDRENIKTELYNSDEEVDQKEMDLFTGCSLDTKFICPKPIQLEHNSDKPNYDHRGSNHTKIILLWNKNWTVIPKNDTITLGELAECYYRIKSHKWDQNYELFCRSKIDSARFDDVIRIKMTFDYGS